MGTYCRAISCRDEFDVRCACAVVTYWSCRSTLLGGFHEYISGVLGYRGSLHCALYRC